MKSTLETLQKNHESTTPDMRQQIITVYEQIKPKYEELQRVHVSFSLSSEFSERSVYAFNMKDSIRRYRLMLGQYEARSSSTSSTNRTDESVAGSKSTAREMQKEKISPDLFGDGWISDKSASPFKDGSSPDTRIRVEETSKSVEDGDASCR